MIRQYIRLLFMALSIAVTMAGCATHETSSGSSIAAPTDRATQVGSPNPSEQHRKLPKVANFGGHDFYPAEAVRRHLEGRVLVELHIDSGGKPINVKLIQAEAGSVLQTQAVHLVRQMRFDVTSPGFDTTDPSPYRVTVRFCLRKPHQPPDCTIELYPDTDDVAITGTWLPM
jgi:TonB family protein